MILEQFYDKMLSSVFLKSSFSFGDNIKDSELQKLKSIDDRVFFHGINLNSANTNPYKRIGLQN